MAGRHWSEIDQDTWEDISIYITEEGNFSVEFDYVGLNGVEYHYPREEIDFEEFLEIYDEAIELDQEIEVEYG
jgi:Protein of unknown function, DUF600